MLTHAINVDFSKDGALTHESDRHSQKRTPGLHGMPSTEILSYGDCKILFNCIKNCTEIVNVLNIKPFAAGPDLL